MYSKTTCPFAAETKKLLTEKRVKFKLIELDTLPNGALIQSALEEKTGQRTVPNVFIDGKHIGGNSDVQKLGKRGVFDKKTAA